MLPFANFLTRFVCCAEETAPAAIDLSQIDVSHFRAPPQKIGNTQAGENLAVAARASASDAARGRSSWDSPSRLGDAPPRLFMGSTELRLLGGCGCCTLLTLAGLAVVAKTQGVGNIIPDFLFSKQLLGIVGRTRKGSLRKTPPPSGLGSFLRISFREDSVC